MAAKETTPPPATAAAPASSPLTPKPKRLKMSSPDVTALKNAQDTESVAAPQPESTSAPTEQQPQSRETTTATGPSTPATSSDDDHELPLEADGGDADSAFGTDSSDTTSIATSIYNGYIEHGRRWQVVREGEYWGPSDEMQFQAMQAAHITYLILDSPRTNHLFRSPIPETAQNILDLGTGNGAWARDVADAYPGAVVQGIDLYPPPDDWVPPNCKFTVDDMLKRWEFQENGRFDLIHVRDLMASFTDEQWRLVCKQAYNNLAPGGWYEEAETGITFYSDDGSLPADSLLANWGDLFTRLWASTGKKIDTINTMKARIEAAGFTNVQEKWYKVPLGDWAKNRILKEAGQFCKAQMLEGMEGYTIYALTKFGLPEPWSAAEVQVYLAKVRKEMEAPGLHAYLLKRRVWGQKPYASPSRAE